MTATGSPATPAAAQRDRVRRETLAWLNRAVIGLNLCPFAKAVVAKGQMRCIVSDATEAQGLLDTLCFEMHHLAEADPARLDTTLIVHPEVLADFADFNDFLDAADAAVESLGYEGVLQVASFHPDYQFAGTDAGDITNATNRAPYPTLHLLLEDSVARAVEAFPEADAIVDHNLDTLTSLGARGWAALQAQCRADAASAEDGDGVVAGSDPGPKLA